MNSRFGLNSELSVVFDLDGTLVDTAPDLCLALNFVLRNAGLQGFCVDEMRPFVGQGARGLLKRALHLHSEEVSDRELDQWTLDFVDYYRAHIAELSQPFPGVQALLSRLYANDIKMGICTNKREELSLLLLEKLDLMRYFPVVLGADSLKVHKPDPQHLLATIERMSGSPDQSVFVGDSATDTKTAKAAGVPIIGVSFGYTDTPIHELEPDYVIDHFDHFESAVLELSEI